MSNVTTEELLLVTECRPHKSDGGKGHSCYPNLWLDSGSCCLPGETRVAMVLPILKICNADVPVAKKHLFSLVLAWHPSMLQSQQSES